MSASFTTSSCHDLSLLVNYASDLACLLRRAKSRLEGSASNSVKNISSSSSSINSSESSESIHEEVGQAIKGVLQELKGGTQGQGQLVEESVGYVRDKIEGILQEFIKVDPANAAYYKRLTQSIKSHQQSSYSGIDASSLPASASGEASEKHLVPLKEDFDFEDKFGQLTSKEKQCLFCFSLFPQGSVIGRRVIISWWVAMGLIKLRGSDGSGKAQGDKLLAGFTDEGFILQTIRNNKVSNSYRMHAGIRSQVIQQAVLSDDSWLHKAALLQKYGPTSVHGKSDLEAEKVEVLLNIGKHTLDATATIFDWFTGMKNVKVAHLGSWHQYTEYDIVVDDIDFLKALKHLGQLRLLSLQGMLGIVELPNFIYKLENLKVLDLRACHYLEFLPEGIESLQQLTHLDLSKCYLLDHIPKGIASLSKLRVLKGFIIKPDPDSNVGTENLENASSCAFSELVKLRQLTKLTIRTRRMTFPTRGDLETILKMVRLKKLRVAWVGSSSDAEADHSDLDFFPENLEKLELEAAPKKTALQLLWLISHQKKLLRLIRQEDSRLCEISIIGGELENLGTKEYCLHSVTKLHLRYLPKLQLNWSQCRDTFPDLAFLDIYGCPGLTDFPCKDNGVWKLNNSTL